LLARRGFRAGFSQQADSPHRTVRAGRRPGPHRARRRREAFGEHRPAGDRGESRRRLGRHRLGGRCALGARRLYDPAFNPKSLPYDAIKDFTPISLVATIPHALIVNSRLPVGSVQDLVRLGKSRSLNYGSAGNGSPHHLAAELFKSLTAIEAVHVPYKGSGPALADLMGGNLDFISVEYTAAEPHVKSGKLKALATATAQRVPGIDLPTVAEAGYQGFEVTSWYAIFGPAGMPADVTGKLSSEIHKAVTGTELRDRLIGLGTTPIGSTPEALAAYQRSDIDRWTKVVRTANIRPE
jgi:tripartite-type tricarboxylate transporter receptor subunit TctC